VFSKKKVTQFANVGKYVVEIVGRNAVMTFTRDWQNASGRVITQLGAESAARIAVQQLGASRVFSVSDQSEMPVITVPASILSLPTIRFRISGDGEEMNARIATQKATRSFEKRAAGVARKNQVELTKLGLKF
jgi:hypothetical protein